MSSTRAAKAHDDSHAEAEYLAECRSLLADETDLLRVLREDDLNDDDRRSVEYNLRAIQARLAMLRQHYDAVRGIRDMNLLLWPSPQSN